MNKENKKIIIGCLVLLVIVLGIVYVVTKDNSNNKTSTNNNSTNSSSSEVTANINTTKNIESVSTEGKDFSGYDTYSINLSNESGMLEITKAGVYTLTGNLDGYIKVDTEDNVKLILDNVTITNSNGPGIYVETAKNTYIELVGESTITDGSSYSGFDEDVNGVIYSKDDLFLLGSGTYNITSKDDGIRGKDSVTIIDGTFNLDVNGDGIKSTNDEDTEKGNITIENGVFNIKAENDGIQAENTLSINDGTYNIVTNGGSKSATTYNEWNSKTSSDDSAKALKAGVNIIINGGTFDISSYDDGMYSNGNITINYGKITIISDDDAIHADGMLEINGGTFTLTAHEGMEATYVKINDGKINISASDDGINAGNKSKEYSVLIEINGGDITIKMGSGDTDGVDSNGDIIINGGTINVTGQSTFDYDGTGTINGGTVISNGEKITTLPNQFMGGGMNNRGMQDNMNMPGGRMMR